MLLNEVRAIENSIVIEEFQSSAPEFDGRVFGLLEDVFRLKVNFAVGGNGNLRVGVDSFESGLKIEGSEHFLLLVFELGRV